MPAGHRLSAAVLARMRGGCIKAAVVWQLVSAGTGPATPPLSAAAWNTGQMPSLPGLGIAWRDLVPQAGQLAVDAP